MQLEDPRVRYRQLQNEHASTESIPMHTSLQVFKIMNFFHFLYQYHVVVVVVVVQL